MNAWRVAWRLRMTALAASLLPAALTVLLYILEYVLIELFGGGNVGFIAVETLYFAIEALFVGALLEVSMAATGMPSVRQAVLPSYRAAVFAVLLALVGLATILAQAALSELTANWLSTAIDGGLGRGELWLYWIIVVLEDPAMQWLPAGLLAPLAALRTLSLPRLASRPSARPSRGLVAAVVEAVVLAILVYRGAEAVLQMAGATVGLVYFAIWYIVAVTTLTLIVSAIGVMLMRRAGQPALA